MNRIHSRRRSPLLTVAGAALILFSTACESSFRGETQGLGHDGDQVGQPDPDPCPNGFDPDGGCIADPPLDPPPGDDPPTPPTHADLSGLSKVVAGAQHACALTSGGTVKCWGDNSYGQLGSTAVSAYSSLALDVSGLTGVTALAAGAYHTCALTGGNVFCWGRNNKGQLGNDSTSNSVAPVQVLDLTNVAQIGAGDEHTCALKTGAAATGFCWGSNRLAGRHRASTGNCPAAGDQPVRDATGPFLSRRGFAGATPRLRPKKNSGPENIRGFAPSPKIFFPGPREPGDLGLFNLPAGRNNVPP